MTGSEIKRIASETPLTDVMNGSSRWEIRLHEHGFIALVDAMPRLVPQGQTADFAIVQAARVSYGAGTKKVSEDRGLIRYLMRHRHTTPLEMVEFKFHVAMPIFIARQWIRHRTACLAEGTDIHFDLPGGIKRRGNQLYKLPIEEIARRFEPTRNSQRPDKQRNPHFRRDRIRSMRLRQINEDDLRIGHTRIVSVYRNGTKPVFRMTLADGKHIESTADHRFLFADGWHTLKEATGLHLSGSRAVWNADDSYLYVNGTTELVWAKHQEAAWLNEQYNVLNRKIADIAEECGVSYHTVRKWLRLHHLQHRTGGRTHPAWNEGKTYRLGSRKPSAAWLEGNRKSRSGPASNFWKGGISTAREGIARWTTQVAHKVHRINGWTCQLCRTRAGELHCHHVVPVWADRTLAREQSNLTTLCGHCHHKVQGRELEYVEQLGGPPVRTEWRKRPRVPWNKLEVAKLVRLETIEYVGEKPTYDLEVEGPHHNFIANGIVTHNSVNEYSARYSIVQDRFYRPSMDNIRHQSAANRQGGTEPVDVATAEEFLAWLERCESQYETYQQQLEKGVTRELARIGLPVSAYTEWYWKCDLHNIFHFLSLRMDEHAQQEIREYAEAMFALIKPIVPIAAEAFEQYVLHGVHLTQLEIEALRTGQPLASDNKREQAEWEGKKGRMGIESQKSKVKSQNTEDHANE